MRLLMQTIYSFEKTASSPDSVVGAVRLAHEKKEGIVPASSLGPAFTAIAPNGDIYMGAFQGTGTRADSPLGDFHCVNGDVITRDAVNKIVEERGKFVAASLTKPYGAPGVIAYKAA